MRIFTACFAVIVFSAVFAAFGFGGAGRRQLESACRSRFRPDLQKWCSVVRPMVEKLKQEYHDTVEFAELDFTQSELPENNAAGQRVGHRKGYRRRWAVCT